MSLEFVISTAAVLFVLVVLAARPLWDVRHHLWNTLDWRDLTTLGLRVLALLLPIALLMSALPYVPGLENMIPKSLVVDERSLLSNHSNFGLNLDQRGELIGSQGRYIEAEVIFKPALAVIEKQGGLTNPDVSIPLSDLAQLYSDQGRNVEGEMLYERARHPPCFPHLVH